uniref:Uncharacterized protein n=1 Tax=Anguilla anguilla TaxID=7936 RepID=A0A0E9R0X6_ANGAN
MLVGFKAWLPFVDLVVYRPYNGLIHDWIRLSYSTPRPLFTD